MVPIAAIYEFSMLFACLLKQAFLMVQGSVSKKRFTLHVYFRLILIESYIPTEYTGFEYGSRPIELWKKPLPMANTGAIPIHFLIACCIL